MAELWIRNMWVPLKADSLFSHIPKEHRSMMVQLCKDRDGDMSTWKLAQKPFHANWDASYILSHGQHKCFCWYYPSVRMFKLRPDPKYPYAEHLTTERPTTGCPTTEPPIAERGEPISNNTSRTLMQSIRFWKTPASRRLVR
ncbi:hypothetical protein P691DRAFT_763006 [Macrolepiota fuliginosa MF-IS2]|uniref:Uncharacterized protein n=1 Tax=Macrolepiota fuliginosa MF-IS2 TaxID=1400762 RepID=A0A9P5X5E6_9AGAR|nr:hypothetical protein P691DRAFT_763006 [Macrolepiota fuliginosa MF-IS2]